MLTRLIASRNYVCKEYCCNSFGGCNTSFGGALTPAAKNAKNLQIKESATTEMHLLFSSLACTLEALGGPP